MTRRDVLKNGFKTLSLLASGGFVFSVLTPANAKSSIFLRPPGSIDEADFLKKCIKCGLCVQACKYETLKLAEFNQNIKEGTPYFKPREIPCYLCKDLPCVISCPTGALDIKKLRKENSKEIEISKVKMGVSVIDVNNCVAHWGIQCDACYRACPFIDKALKLEYRRNERTAKHAFLLPVVDPNFCTGCGKCEHACITKKPAIRVFPREVALGEVGDNYVKGWQKNGDEKLKNANTEVKLDKNKAVNYLNSEEF